MQLVTARFFDKLPFGRKRLLSFPAPFPTVTSATKQLTEALQKLVEQEPKFRNSAPLPVPDPARMTLSPEIDRFIQERREYMDKTRTVSVGSY